MAFTDNCDVFGSIHEDGFNTIVGHVTRQRPSLFNYGTRFFALRPEMLCHRIDAHPEVTRRGNPLITIEDPLPIPGTNGLYGLDFCVQLVKLAIDFHPGNAVALPPELAPLGRQGVAFEVEACAGILCPDQKFVDAVGDDLASRRPVKDDKDRDPRETPRLPPLPLPGDKVHCFCLTVFAVAHIERLDVGGREFLVVRLDGLEIVDIKPEGLEDALECYVATVLRLAVLPRLRIAVETLVFEIDKSLNPPITLKLTPISPAVPNNPAVEDDQLKVFASFSRGDQWHFHGRSFGRHVSAPLRHRPRPDHRVDERQRGSWAFQP